MEIFYKLQYLNSQGRISTLESVRIHTSPHRVAKAGVSELTYLDGVFFEGVLGFGCLATNANGRNMEEQVQDGN